MDKLLHILPLIIAIVGQHAGPVAIAAGGRDRRLLVGMGVRRRRQRNNIGRAQRVFRAIDLEACRRVQPERSEEKRGDIRFRLAVRCIVPDRRDGLARRRTMQLQRSFCRQLERQMDCSDAKGIPLTISIKRIDVLSGAIPAALRRAAHRSRSSLVSGRLRRITICRMSTSRTAISASESSRTLSPAPASRATRSRGRTIALRRRRRRGRLDRRGDEIAELEHERRDIGDLSDDVLEVDDRGLDVSLHLEEELRNHVREFLHLEIIQIRRSAQFCFMVFFTRSRASFPASRA